MRRVFRACRFLNGKFVSRVAAICVVVVAGYVGISATNIERYVEGVTHFEPREILHQLTSPAYIQDIYTLPSHREYIITFMLRTILHHKTFKTQFNTCYRTICYLLWRGLIASSNYVLIEMKIYFLLVLWDCKSCNWELEIGPYGQRHRQEMELDILQF